MIFNNKHYIKWSKDIKALINRNIRAIKNNSISKITITNNRFYKLLIFVLYKVYALIKHILIFNHSKAKLGIVKYFTVFITLLLWIFVLFTIYVNNITNVASFIYYINNILDPLIESLNQNTQLDEILEDFLNKFKSYNEYLEDYFIDVSIDVDDNKPNNYSINKTESTFNKKGNIIPDNVIDSSNNIISNALIGIGIIIVIAGIYYGIINQWYDELRGLGIKDSTINNFEKASIPLNEVIELYKKGLSCDQIYNYYMKNNMNYANILTTLNQTPKTPIKIEQLNALTDVVASLNASDNTLGGSLSGTKPWSSINTIGYDATPIAESSNSGLLREQQNTILSNITPSGSDSPASSGSTTPTQTPISIPSIVITAIDNTEINLIPTEK